MVRTATPEDAEAIARIQIRTWQVAYAHLFPADGLARLPMREERRARSWRERIEAREARTDTVVAGKGERILGFASFGQGQEDDTIGELYAIYVLPEAWGGGIGRRLMVEVLERLGQGGFTEAILWVLEDNPRTRRYYELAGWHVDGGVKDETILDTLVREVRYRIALDGLRSREDP